MELSTMPQYGVLTAVEEIEKPMATTQLQPFPKSGLQTIPSSVSIANIIPDTASNISAGHRITQIYELLELTLLSLPPQDLLLAQRVSRRFYDIVNTSPRLRAKLFFTSRLEFGRAFKAEVNPMILREGVLERLPLWWDCRERRLVRCWGEECERVVWRGVRGTTVWVYVEMEVCDGEMPPLGGPGGEERRMGVLERGSWERMFISQPSCFVSWRLRLSGTDGGKTYSGIVKGARTMGSLIDGLVDTSLVRQ